MKLLGLRLCDHDSSIAYFDGATVRYYKSERAYQTKHHGFNDLWSWRDVVADVWGLDYNDVDEIAVVLDPWAHKLPENNEDFFPSVGYDLFPAPCKVHRVDHHYAHALSGWMLEESDIQFVFDGFGDRDIAWSVFAGGKLLDKGKMSVQGSLGRAMEEMARNMYIEASHPQDLAGKAMGLQSHGVVDERFLASLAGTSLDNVTDMFSLDRWINHKKDVVLARHTLLDWSATVHEHAGNALVSFFKRYAKPTDSVFYSGGVAQNVVWNTKLKRAFPNLTIPPHCGDEGLSLGALEFLRRKHELPPFSLPDFPFVQSDSGTEKVTLDTIELAATKLAEGKVIGWYQGHGEVGPRALGNRSILAAPTVSKARVNDIKRREQYRPFGASVLSEHASKWFEGLPDNPYMLYIGHSNTALAVTHVDGSSRAQTVDKKSTFGQLITLFMEKTGYPFVLNTSLNVNGRPIANSPLDALELFNTSSLDCLFVGNTFYAKE